MIVRNLRCEWLAGTPTIDTTSPRLIWDLSSRVQGDGQTAYQVQCGSTVGASDLWDTGKVVNAAQQAVYGGVALTSRKAVYWQVRAWNTAGSPSQWIAASFDIGLLNTSDWASATYIGYQTGPVASSSPAACLRKNFAVTKMVSRARLYISALGEYIPFLNGQRIGQVDMAPGWTDYGYRRQYQSYTVTSLIAATNALGVQVGDGWAHGNLSLKGRNYFGVDVPRIICVLYIDYTDGTSDAIISDTSWVAISEANLANDHYVGVTHDNRLASNFSNPSTPVASWSPVSGIAAGSVPLVAQPSRPVQRMKAIPAVAVTNPSTGVYVFDFGVNHSGTPVLNMAGATPGQHITLRHAEDLKKDGSGNIYTANLRTALQTDNLYCSGAAVETIIPRFGQKGYRYVEVTGFTGTPPIGTVVSHQLYTPSPLVSTFDCSSAVLLGSWNNATQAWVSNALSIPSDCNQRDERLGWAADAHLFSRSATYVQDSAAFFDKYCSDLDDSTASGKVGDVAPYHSDVSHGSACWGEAAIFIPWTLYQVYGDTRFLSKHFANMKAILPTLPYGNTYNDYLSLSGNTDATVFTYAFAYRAASIVKQVADLLGDTATSSSAASSMASFLSTWNGTVSNGGATIGNNTQTAYILGLAFGMLPTGQRAAAFNALVTSLNSNGFNGGFVGLTYLHDVLSDNGRLDLAYSIAEKTTDPALGYAISLGLTTTSEQWNPRTSQGSNDGANSYNHYVRGAVLSWIARDVAGIDAATPGYATVLFRPRPGGGANYASLTFDGPRGRIKSVWNVRSNRMLWHVSIPANSTGLVVLPPAYGTAKIAGADISTIGTAQAVDAITGGKSWLMPSGSYDIILTA